MVLCRGAHESWSSDINLFDDVGGWCPRGNGLAEGVEVDNDELEGLDTQFLELLCVRLEAQVSQNSRVNAGVQGFDAAVERFGEARHFADLGDLVSSITNGLRGRTRRNQLDAIGYERGNEVEQTGLIADGDEGALNRNGVAFGVQAGVVTRSAHERVNSWRLMWSREISRTVATMRSRSTILMRSCKVSSDSPTSMGTTT